MLMQSKKLWMIAIISTLLVSGLMLGNASAQKAAVPKSQDRLAMGEDQVRQLLALMETDKKGMVSKQEFMNFMAAEFERLDKNKKGELNAKELTQSTLTVNRYVGK
jgi:Ca2+-binding EF-hand superfamily protein